MKKKKIQYQKPNTAIIGVLLVAEVIGVLIGGYLTLLHYDCLGDPFCNINKIISCTDVVCGPFSEIFRIPISYLGILTYLVCMALTILGTQPQKSRFHAHVPNYLLAISIWCVIYSIFLAGVIAFVIKSVCIFCMALYVVNIVLLVCCLIWTKDLPEGRWEPLKEDLPKALGMPKVWGATILLGIFLVISASLLPAITPSIVTCIWPRPPSPLAGNFDLRDNPWKSNPNAPVVVIEVSDPKCPWCAKSHEVIKKAQKTYGDKFYLFFNHYPLDQECNEGLARTIHPQACIGSYASHCAQKQDVEKFWEYMDILFKRQKEDWDLEVLTGYATEIDLNIPEFRQCMADPKTKAVIRQDIADCVKNEVHSTPTIFFNDKSYGPITSGVPKFLEVLERALTEEPEASKATTSEATVVPD